MVSRVYTPLVTPYARAQGANANRGAVTSVTDEQARSSRQQSELNGDATDLRRPSSGLQSVQYDRFQKIPLTAVISDFKNTMTALGADDQTRSEVSAYLNVVRLQAAKDQPEVPFIKHTLRTAANSLDQYIGKALGQPSQVVKEWVDALLMQNIDYHADLPPEETELAAIATAAGTSTDQEAELPTATEATAIDATSDTATRARLKSLVDASKANRQAGQSAEADQNLQDALDLLADQGRPDWQGKLWQMRGRLADQDGRWEQAVQHFDQAATHFEAAQLPDKQANALHAMASILEEHGQLDQAKQTYQQVVALDEQTGNPKAKLRSLNDLGGVHLRQGNPSEAVATFEKAASLMSANPAVPSPVQSDILSNLGAAYRQNQQYEPAIQAYQQSLQAAKTAKDKSRYTSTLQQLASLYVEANQPSQAMKALQRLQSLNIG
jgi:tetratricopeptide (TPR) repeat protein